MFKQEYDPSKCLNYYLSSIHAEQRSLAWSDACRDLATHMQALHNIMLDFQNSAEQRHLFRGHARGLVIAYRNCRMSIESNYNLGYAIRTDKGGVSMKELSKMELSKRLKQPIIESRQNFLNACQDMACNSEWQDNLQWQITHAAYCARYVLPPSQDFRFQFGDGQPALPGETTADYQNRVVITI